MRRDLQKRIFAREIPCGRETRREGDPSLTGTSPHSPSLARTPAPLVTRRDNQASDQPRSRGHIDYSSVWRWGGCVDAITLFRTPTRHPLARRWKTYLFFYSSCALQTTWKT